MSSPAERVAEALVPERAEHEVREMSREEENKRIKRERDSRAFDSSTNGNGKPKKKNILNVDPLFSFRSTHPRASPPQSCKSTSTPSPAAEKRRLPEPTVRWPPPLDLQEKEEKTTTLVALL